MEHSRTGILSENQRENFASDVFLTFQPFFFFLLILAIFFKFIAPFSLQSNAVLPTAKIIPGHMSDGGDWI